MKKENYKNQIGDGKLPNKYWVFHYDQKYKRIDNGEFKELVPIDENEKHEGGLIGEYKTYTEALNAVDNKAYYPNVTIEDRISGQVFEQYCIVCECCGKEEWETNDDIGYTKKRLGSDFK
jgi:hypothetical protein